MTASPSGADLLAPIDPVRVKLSKKYRLGGPMNDAELRINHELLKEISRAKKGSADDASSVSKLLRIGSPF